MNPIAGDVDYAVHGVGYAGQRRPDPRIAALIHEAIDGCRVVLNVGAGAGSYEPTDRTVIAIEPAAAMRAQRPPSLSPAIRGIAEDLPLDDQSVDAAMALVTVHQWRDLERGLAELRRVTRGPIVVLTFDGDALGRFWLSEYAPELAAVERSRFPPIARLVDGLGGAVTVTPVPVPIDCTDGFSEAFYARPEAFLDERVRRAQSAWSFLEPAVHARIVDALAADLRSGRWAQRHGAWRAQPSFEGSLRLLVSRGR